MMPQRIIGETNRLVPPRDWVDERDGKCVSLSIRVEDSGALASAWEPTPAELECLNAGGRVVLRIYANGHPPVMLSAEPAA